MIDAPADSADWVKGLGIVPEALVLTHQHFDHVLDAAKIAALGVPVHAWSGFDRALLLEDVVKQWGMPFDVEPYEVHSVLCGREQLKFGALTFELRHLPGHSPDSVILLDRDSGVVFAGDTLFAGSTGRADLPGGDFSLLCRGIREQIYTLDAGIRVLPGHGPETTVGEESASNSVVRAD